MKCSLILSGDELLKGKTRDSHLKFIASSLHSLGHTVVEASICPDNPSLLLERITQYSAISELIIMTGGLGPTSDDHTSSVIADFFKVPLEFNEEAWTHCCKVFQRRGVTDIPEVNRKQAYLPKSLETIPNPKGTALGIWMSSPDMTLCALPGVPSELEPMWNESIVPKITSASELKEFEEICIDTVGIGESKLQNTLIPLEKELSPYSISLHYQAHLGYVTVSVLLPLTAPSHLKPLINNFFREHFAHNIFCETPTPFIDQVQNAFKNYGLLVLDEVGISDFVSLHSVLPHFISLQGELSSLLPLQKAYLLKEDPSQLITLYILKDKISLNLPLALKTPLTKSILTHLGWKQEESQWVYPTRRYSHVMYFSLGCLIKILSL